MGRSSVIVASLFAALVLGSAVGCGGGKHEPAKAPEGNPWADYKGTYAGAPEAHATEPVKPKSPSTDTKAMVGSVATASKTDEDAAAPAAPTKKATGKKRTKAVAKKAPKKG